MRVVYISDQYTKLQRTRKRVSSRAGKPEIIIIFEQIRILTLNSCGMQCAPDLEIHSVSDRQADIKKK